MVTQGIKKVKKSRMVFDETTQVSVFPSHDVLKRFLVSRYCKLLKRSCACRLRRIDVSLHYCINIGIIMIENFVSPNILWINAPTKIACNNNFN